MTTGQLVTEVVFGPETRVPALRDAYAPSLVRPSMSRCVYATYGLLELTAVSRRMIEDNVSGELVRATLEATCPVQVFSKPLVEDYGQPKDHI